MEPLDTKNRILDAAEELFGALGFQPTSLRAITAQAEVNLAAVHYHFGGKAALLQAVIERRVGKINAERLQMLDQVEARQPESPDLEAVLEAFLAPPLRLAGDPDEGHASFMRLMGRLFSTPGDHALRAVFQTVFARFVAALAKAAPHLDQADLLWRFHFLLGSMALHMIDPERIGVASGGLCDSADPEGVLRQMVAHNAAAFRAPAVLPIPGGAR